MSKKYDTLVYIGRFQPVHNAHIEIIEKAKTLADRIIIIVGSNKKPRTYKNPFTSAERIDMLKGWLDPHKDKMHWDGSKPEPAIYYRTVQDSLYNDQAWAARIQATVSDITTGGKTGIIGHKKDESSFYFDLFPQWDFEEVGLIEPLNATNVRELFFRKDANLKFIKMVVPPTVFDFLNEFKDTQEFKDIVEERDFITKYKKQYASFPFPPTFITTDAVVIQSGHVLMIKRRALPGKGLWALPGGFLDADTDNSLKDCMLRELKEETGIKVPVPVLSGSIVDNKVFDALFRSERGRTVTHAYKIVLPDGELPKVKGGDDAEKAKWIPIGELDPSVCYEDHYEIISHFVGA